MIGLYIKPSEDSKTKFKSGQKNSFGLMPGPEWSCPAATNGSGGCWSDGHAKTCYVWKLTHFRKNMRMNLEHNFNVLNGCRGSERVEVLVREFKRFLYDGGPGDKFYRLHWSGDIFSADYAEDLMLACKEVPNVTFWNFTRNFNDEVIEKIVKYKPSNLIQYLSADTINADRALEVYKKFPDTFSISYMGDSCKPFRDMLEKVSGADIKIYQCPSNGKHTGVEFMCKKCKTCLKGKCVFFKTRK